jgi:hypothetical protein
MGSLIKMIKFLDWQQRKLSPEEITLLENLGCKHLDRIIIDKRSEGQPPHSLTDDLYPTGITISLAYDKDTKQIVSTQVVHDNSRINNRIGQLILNQLHTLNDKPINEVTKFLDEFLSDPMIYRSRSSRRNHRKG